MDRLEVEMKRKGKRECVCVDGIRSSQGGQVDRLESLM